MDFRSIFHSYCVEQGIDPPDEASRCHILRIDDLELTVTFLIQGVGIGTRIARLSEIPRDTFELLLSTSLFLTEGRSRACPLNFTTDSETDSLLMVGARDRIDDLNDFKTMLDSYLSLRAMIIDTAKKRGIEGFSDDA